MQFALRKGQLKIDLSSVSMAVLILSWSAYYYYTTLTGTDAGPDTVLFIKPVFFGILICFPFVIWSAVSITPEGESATRKVIKKTKDRGLLEKHRMFITAASIGYCLILPVLGYPVSSALYVITCFYFFKSRNLWLLLVLPIGLSCFLSMVFKMLLLVPVPIWPVWYR